MYTKSELSVLSVLLESVIIYCLLYYILCAGVLTSDHKPVWGMFEVKVKPGKDSIPLAGGLFNRQVYLEGLKRRSESLKPRIGKGGTTNMCQVS